MGHPAHQRRTAGIPARLCVGSPHLVAAIIGRQQHYATAVARWAVLSIAWPGHPRLRTALAEAIRLDDDDFNRALDVAAWLAEHRNSGLMPRQLPVEGIGQSGSPAIPGC